MTESSEWVLSPGVDVPTINDLEGGSFVELGMTAFVDSDARTGRFVAGEELMRLSPLMRVGVCGDFLRDVEAVRRHALVQMFRAGEVGALSFSENLNRFKGSLIAGGVAISLADEEAMESDFEFRRGSKAAVYDALNGVMPGRLWVVYPGFGHLFSGDVRAVIVEDELRWCLNDLCSRIGLIEDGWVELASDEVGEIVLTVPGQDQALQFVSNVGVISILLLGETKECRLFRRWVAQKGIEDRGTLRWSIA